eukprot:1978483-Lingulodinium_polyedra.AAC.1
MDQSWECRWPRPATLAGEVVVKVTLNTDMTFDLESMITLKHSRQGEAAILARKFLAGVELAEGETK